MSNSQARAARRKPVQFVYDGDTWEVSPSDVTLDVMEAAEAGRLVTATRRLLGDDQYERYKAKHPTVAELEPFFQAMWDALATGNSGASPSS